MNDKEFKEWEGETFGYGYGSGEEFTLRSLIKFFALMPKTENYDYSLLEKEMGGDIFWLMLTILMRSNGVLSYGTSPRYGWLDDKGKEIKEYLELKTPEYLYELVMRNEP